MPTAPKPSKKPDVRRVVTITGTFGSTMQRDFATRTLTQLLEIWRNEVELRHKENKLTIKEE